MKRLNLIVILSLVALMVVVMFVLRPRIPDGIDPIKGHSPENIAQITLYFSKNKGNDVVTDTVRRDVPKEYRQSFETVFEYTIAQLLQGPTAADLDQGFFSEIPNTTALLSVQETDEGIYIDLSKTYIVGGGSNSMVQRLQELTKTVASVPQPKPVYLRVEGESIEALGGEGVIVHDPLTEDPSVTQ